jgi:ATP-dependent DNA helicase HFM1/MER3
MSDRSLLLVSPTGTGKTVVAELCLVGRMQRRLLSLESASVVSPSMLLGGKMVYLAPMTALCAEKATDWRARFGALGLKVATLSGDASIAGSEASERFSMRQDVLSADVICTTPERWDALTRRWKDHIGLVGRVAILVIDEVHHVGSSRGAALESIVSRMVSLPLAYCFLGLACARAWWRPRSARVDALNFAANCCIL